LAWSARDPFSKIATSTFTSAAGKDALHIYTRAHARKHTGGAEGPVALHPHGARGRQVPSVLGGVENDAVPTNAPALSSTCNPAEVTLKGL
jgi:hypothetical protein